MIRYLIILLVFLFIPLFIVDEAHPLSERCRRAEELYLQGDYRGAAYECERLLQGYNKDEFKVEVSYLLALCYLKLKEPSLAKRYFEYVLNNSSDPLLVNEANIGLANIKETPSLEGPSFFSVQIGSFKYKQNAEKLYNRFKKKRYVVRIIKEKDSRDTVYKVKVGKFELKEDATEFAKELKRAGYPTAVVNY